MPAAAEHPNRRMRVVNDLRRRRDPKDETLIGERACELDVVEEDRIALVEDAVVGKERPPQEQTTRRRLRYRSRLREILVEHPVLAKPSCTSGQELATSALPFASVICEGRKPKMKRLRRAVGVHVQRADAGRVRMTREELRERVERVRCECDVGVEKQDELATRASVCLIDRSRVSDISFIADEGDIGLASQSLSGAIDGAVVDRRSPRMTGRERRSAGKRDTASRARGCSS